MSTFCSKSIFILSALFGVVQWFNPQFVAYVALMPFDAATNIPKYTINLLTHIFFHLDVIHFSFNMLILGLFGTQLENKIGSVKFSIVFMLSGVLSGLGYTLFSLMIGENIGGVGASGAIMGLFACLAILEPKSNVYVFFTKMKLINALYLSLIVFTLFISTATIAHLSGIAAGTIFGIIFGVEHGTN